VDFSLNSALSVTDAIRKSNTEASGVVAMGTGSVEGTAAHRRAGRTSNRRAGRLVALALVLPVLAAACALPRPGAVPRGGAAVVASRWADGTPVFSSRDVTTWPFASTSPWNMPRGDGATFDGRQVASGGNINASNGWGVTVGGADQPWVDQAHTLAYQEGHVSIVRADGVTAEEWYQYYNLGNPNRNSSITDLRGDGLRTNISPGTGSLHQQRASQVSQLGGLIRSADLATGFIPHALAVALPNGTLRSGWVWPATSQDGDAATAYTGFVPMGSLLAIPSGTPMPPGLSAAGQMIWTALRDYGAYVVDRTTPSSVLFAEAAAEGAVSPARRDLPAIMSQVRLVTNSGPGSVGGPGNRLAPLAPPV